MLGWDSTWWDEIKDVETTFYNTFSIREWERRNVVREEEHFCRPLNHSFPSILPSSCSSIFRKEGDVCLGFPCRSVTWIPSTKEDDWSEIKVFVAVSECFWLNCSCSCCIWYKSSCKVYWYLVFHYHFLGGEKDGQNKENMTRGAW